MRKYDTHLISDFYNSRYEELGANIKSIGWKDADSQNLRFDILFRGIDIKGKTILDVGCGLGDLIPYLESRYGQEFDYIGIDISENILKEARQIHERKNRKFILGDVFSSDLPFIDISILSGALSFKFPEVLEYAQETLNKMFLLSNEVVSMNFLTKYVDFELEKNQHYQPEILLSWAMRVSKKTILFHDYPLHEFTIQIYK
jgi:SAM-dependent methyltransferase